jgi:hypothetical protein
VGLGLQRKAALGVSEGRAREDDVVDMVLQQIRFEGGGECWSVLRKGDEAGVINEERRIVGVRPGRRRRSPVRSVAVASGLGSATVGLRIWGNDGCRSSSGAPMVQIL